MLLSVDNPVYNTIIVFSVIMLLVYITKPDVVYDNEKHEFRQFGMTDGKTLLPIYVIGILLAIILYVFFYYISINQKNVTNGSKKRKIIEVVSSNGLDNDYEIKNNDFDNKYRYYLQQQQIQQLQSQLNQFVQQQMIQHQMNTQIQNVYKTNTSNNAILPNDLYN